ncbi:CPBP family intramembrane metalloprotease [Trichocoleus desertorum AS-A10]|uniref:CPBP family intramembrane glutamic endopeptidase n=1 Tax=Trichocoleus desertorum TaxID=1481672 RepID=UPI00329883E7
MKLKQLILGVLTIIAIAFIGLSLAQSWSQPQVQSRLELYQTNLLLHASEWQGDANSDVDLKGARDKLIGDEPVKAALKQYQEARQSVAGTLAKLETRSQPTLEDRPLARTLKPETQPKVAPATETPAPKTQAQQSQEPITQMTRLIHELDLRLGVLQAQQEQTVAALATWNQLIDTTQPSSQFSSLGKTATALVGLWSTPSSLLPDAELQIKQELDGWFRYQALTRLYKLQQRQTSLSELQTTEQDLAQQAALKLLLIAGIPVFGFLIGIGILVYLVVQWLVKGKQALLVQNGTLSWPTSWGGETIWQVLVLFFVGQFFVGQIALPLGLQLLGINPASFDSRTQAIYILAVYALLVTVGLLVLYSSLKPFLPLPDEEYEDWFRINGGGNWFWWGLGGYFMALPLVILVSLINQQFWQGQGGSNPILPIVLEGRDNVALVIFFLTASVAAPLFEEVMFRGFLLPSLTRYVPVWGAITISAFLFALAHLSLSEILPLMVLGMVLGFVYTRSRNLLAPMLMHSLWNSGTLLSLFILGSGST